MRLLLAILLAGLAAFGVSGCRTGTGGHAVLIPLASAVGARALPCTPLSLTIAGGEERGQRIVGTGSGVLVHPRVIATVGHVVPPGARYVTCFAPGGGAGETVRIERVVGGERSGLWDGDWALLVLAEPFRSLATRMPGRILGAEGGALAPGTTVRMAGFPYATGPSDPFDRREVMIEAAVSRPPDGVRATDAVAYAGDAPAGEFTGMSGGPVVADPDGGGEALVGLYAGRAGRAVLGWRLSETLAFQRVPTAAIRSVVDEFDGVRASGE